MNKQDIINEINRLNGELPLRQKIAEISEHEGLGFAIDELTEHCCAAIKSTNYKVSISQIKDLKIIQAFKEYLKSQQDRIDAIHSKIAQLKVEMTRCQLSIFGEEDSAKRATGVKHDDRELFTGDIFEAVDRNFLLISESSENPDKYVILHSATDTELLLHYVKNRECLKDTAFLGNLFDDEKLQEVLSRFQPEAETEEEPAEPDDELGED